MRINTMRRTLEFITLKRITELGFTRGAHSVISILRDQEKATIEAMTNANSTVPCSGKKPWYAAPRMRIFTTVTIPDSSR